MAQDTKYGPVEAIYRSVGLIARDQLDEAPPYSYIQYMNIFERAENSISSRYGYKIINREATNVFPETGTNQFFSAPVTSLAKMYYPAFSFGGSQRFAGLGNGELWTQPEAIGTEQGGWEQIYTGLSGNPFQTVIASCYETALPYLFIADSSASIKVAVASTSPELWGIDPPDYTANAQPYSPLLTLIDNFSAINSYTASGFSGSWSYDLITNIPAGTGTQVTDFTQFVGVSASSHSIAGGLAVVGAGIVTPETSSITLSGFPSVAVSAGETVNLSVTFNGSVLITSSPGVGNGYINYQYSVNSGVTWETFYTSSGTASITFPSQTISIPVFGLSNLNQLQLMIFVEANNTSGLNPSGTITTAGTITEVQASISDAGIFGTVCNGILSVLNSNSVTYVPIISVTASGQVGDVYTTLTVVTNGPHGASSGQTLSIYGTSNDLADGFYPATVINSTTLTVPFLTPVGYPVPITATGGTLQYVSASNIGPNTCVLTDEYSTPYPTQFSAWGFYQQVPLSASNFPVGAWSGTVAVDTTAYVGVTADFNLSMNNQVTDSDLIVLTLQVGSPANIANIRLQFDVNNSGYTSSYYYANISAAYYQGNIANTISAYNTTQNQILADALGLITGQPESSTTAQLQPSNFSTGSDSWIAVLIPRGNFLPVGSAGQSGLDWTNITGWQLVIETQTTAVTGSGSSTVACNGLYLQWGYGPSSFAGVGYDYRITYYNANTGTESSPSGIMNFNQQYGYLSSLSAPFYLRQAAQVSSYYSTDSQVTHYRVYRRGGIYASNWLLIDQIPNITAGGQFLYKDVVPDSSLAQAQPLVLDNDPPVTSNLINPILITLNQATIGPGNSIYSTYAPQTIYAGSALFGPTYVQNQTVLIGNAYNLEEVLIIEGGKGQFTAIVRLQHNAGEQVQVNSTPRTHCNLTAIANLPGGNTQVWLAGDPNNPHFAYYAKPSLPENFGPENYLVVSTPDDPIMALINWRGVLYAATLKTWYVIVGGAQPYAQPTGAAHGLIASGGWTLAEGVIFFRSADGWRAFSGADGQYMTLPVEWIFRTNPECLPPQVSASNASQDVFAFFNNFVFGSYISLSGERYRLIYDTSYKRFRMDDIAATAMLWEKDTNALICGVPILTASNTIGYAVVADQQYNQDYDDGGWNTASNVLVQTPINIDIQSPYRDLGKPHFPKQWNVLETDANTQNQTLNTTLWFDSGEDSEIVLATANTGTQRQKVQLQVNDGDGNQSYSMSIQHTMAVTTAPTLYQENIYAAILADYRSSLDTYWQKFGSDLLKLVKEAYFDYSATETVTINLYQDGSSVPYYVTELTVQPTRLSVRLLFPPCKCRLWRMVMVSTGNFQLWTALTVEAKPLEDGSGYAKQEFGVYQ